MEAETVTHWEEGLMCLLGVMRELFIDGQINLAVRVHEHYFHTWVIKA